MQPFACLIDPAPECAPPPLLSALSALFSPLCRLAPVAPSGKPLAAAAARLTVLSPSLPEAEARQLARIAALLSGPDAARQGEQVRELAQALLSPAGDAESGGAVLRELRGGRRERAPASSVDPQLVRDLLLLLLTERQAREEAELDAALDRIGVEEGRMLARLRDDEGDEDGESLPMPTEEIGASALPRPEYTAAGLRVLARCESPCARPWFVTRNAALAEALLARYRQGGFGEAVALPALYLPEDPEQARAACPPAATEALARLQEAASADEARRLARDCARFLVDEAPRNAPAPGLLRLEPHVLPGVAFAELWAGLVHADADAGARKNGRDAEEASRPDICLLGFMAPARAA